MSHFLIFVVILALIVICAALWYAVRTHKSLADLHTKFDTAIKPKLQSFEAEATAAAEAAKAKL